MAGLCYESLCSYPGRSELEAWKDHYCKYPTGSLEEQAQVRRSAASRRKRTRQKAMVDFRRQGGQPFMVQSRSQPEEFAPRWSEQLMSQVLDRANLKAAWNQVKANGGACGVDGVSLTDFPDAIRKKWPKMKKGLIEGNYIPLPVRRVEIPKKDGGKRLLGIPTVKAKSTYIQPAFGIC